MNDETQSGRGGKRSGAGRPKGSKVSNSTETFFKRCSAEQKKQLEAYWEKIKE